MKLGVAEPSFKFSYSIYSREKQQSQYQTIKLGISIWSYTLFVIVYRELYRNIRVI